MSLCGRGVSTEEYNEGEGEEQDLRIRLQFKTVADVVVAYSHLHGHELSEGSCLLAPAPDTLNKREILTRDAFQQSLSEAYAAVRTLAPGVR